MTISEDLTLDSHHVYAEINSVLVDISPDIISDIVCTGLGMSSNDVDDRVARSGNITFTLDNDLEKYLPGDICAISGWGENCKVYIYMTFNGETKKILAYVNEITPGDSLEIKTVSVSLVTYINYLNNLSASGQTIQSNKTADVAISTILSGMSVAPQSTSLQTGVNTFETILDTITNKTKAISEINKATLSEGGYFYERNDPVYGEKLVFENYRARNGLIPVKQLPVPIQLANIITDENGSILTDENGSILKYDDVYDFEIGETGQPNRVHGKNIINKLTITAYPKKKDASDVVLYALDDPVFIGINQKVIIKGKYTNPSGGNTINADTTGLISAFHAYTNSDETGTNISASVAAVVTYGSDAPIFEFINNSAYSGYITWIQTTGRGYYQYNYQDVVLEDSVSQNGYGVSEKTIDQQYQRSTAFGNSWGQNILFFEKDPYTNLISMTFNAGYSSYSMQGFINIDFGDLIKVTNAKFEINGNYYVQGLSFTLTLGGELVFTWILKQSFSLMAGLSMASCSFSGTAALNFGVVPTAVNHNLMSIYAEVYPTSISTTEIMTIISTKGFFGTSQCGYELYIKNTTGEVVFTQVYATGSLWETNLTVTANQVNRILVLIDSTQTTPVPVIYLNGVLCTVSIPGGVSAASGSLVDQSGGILYVGNSAFQQSPYNYITPFLGKVKALRVYDDVLSSADIVLANAGTRVTTDLVFEAPCIRTRDIVKYSGLTLTESNKLVDNIYGYIGTPHGSPVSSIEPFIPDQGLSFVDLEFPGATGTGLDFGFVPEVSNLPLRSFAAWVYPHTSLADNAVISIGGDSSNGARIALINRGIKLFQYGTGGVGIWQAYSVPIITLNAWNHIIVTRDSSSATNQPVMYVNGLSKTVTELTAQSGATAAENKKLCIGNTPVMTSYFDGLIRDARIYNKIIDSTEAAYLASGIDVTSGLVFRGMAVRTDYLSKYADKTLNSNDILYESTTGFIPKITGGPIVTRLP